MSRKDLVKLANRLGLWEIVVAGPMGAGFLIDYDGAEYVISSNGTAYPVAELERVAPAFAGRPCYYRHTDTEGRIRTRLIIGDKTRVGKITRSWWQPSTRQIRGVLSVESEYWREELKQTADRWRYAFSMDIDAMAPEAGGLDVVSAISAVYSCDLIDTYPACGGRWLDAPRMTEDELFDARGRTASAISRRENGHES